MTAALAFLVVVLGAGLVIPRWWRPGEGLAAIGLTPAIGICLMSVVGSIFWIIAVPAGMSAAAIVALALAGWLKLGVHAVSGGSSPLGADRRVLVTSLSILVIAALPLLLAYAALAPVEVPLSSQDGAFHAEFVEDRRDDRPRSLVYPPGVHAAMAAVLALMPDVDSAAGVAQMGLVFPSLTVIAAIGLAWALTRSAFASLASGLMLALTWNFPYHPLWWSGWPMAASLLPTVGLWTLVALYPRDQRAALAAVGGVLAGGVVWLHGTEIFTILLGLPAILVAFAREVNWRALGVHLSLALGIALLVLAPFLPDLLWWTGVGGAVAVASQTQNATIMHPADSLADQLVYWVEQGVVSAGAYDFVPRAFLFAFGAWWCVRGRHGRVILVLFLVFTAKAMLFAYSTHPWVLAVYNITFPWAILYRLGTIPAICAALIEGIGIAALLQTVRRWRGETPRSRRRLALLAASGLAALLVLDISAAHVLGRLRDAREAIYTYSSDDRRAMEWMRANVPGEQVVTNDFLADAGIWIPFKAGARNMLNYGRGQSQIKDREYLREHLVELDTSVTSRRIACEIGVGYVFRGAEGTFWHPRSFPPLERLRQMSTLEEVFASGEAAVFQVRLPC